MSRRMGAIAGAVAMVSVGWSTANAGVINVPPTPELDLLPFAVIPEMLPSSISSSVRILPQPPAELPLPSLGVMSLLPGPEMLDDVEPVLINLRDLITLNAAIDGLDKRALPLEIPPLGGSRSRGTILDVFFVIPAPGASALVMLGCFGAMRRRREAPNDNRKT